jgi:hypothetical protein
LEFHDSVEDFQRSWAFDRKESGLGAEHLRRLGDGDLASQAEAA